MTVGDFPLSQRETVWTQAVREAEVPTELARRVTIRPHQDRKRATLSFDTLIDGQLRRVDVTLDANGVRSLGGALTKLGEEMPR